jgi:hypothetical protein
MKTMLLFGAMAVLAIVGSGCQSTEATKTETVKVDENARWVVVSTNEPVSSARMERNSSRVPPTNPSILLAPGGEQTRQEIENSGIPPILKKKMLDGEVLTMADIEELGRYKVSEATILKYLQATPAIYILNTDDVNRLQQAGLGKAVTDYMLATVNQRPVQVVRKYYSYYPYYYDAWWGYPGYYNYGYGYYPGYYHYPHYYGGHHYYGGGGGHYHHGGGGLRVYRPR